MVDSAVARPMRGAFGTGSRLVCLFAASGVVAAVVVTFLATSGPASLSDLREVAELAWNVASVRVAWIMACLFGTIWGLCAVLVQSVFMREDVLKGEWIGQPGLGFALAAVPALVSLPFFGSFGAVQLLGPSGLAIVAGACVFAVLLFLAMEASFISGDRMRVAANAKRRAGAA